VKKGFPSAATAAVPELAKKDAPDLSGRARPDLIRLRDASATGELADRAASGACAPRPSSMRMSWLYFASLSERASEPVLICPQFVATARSAMVESSVSPERCDITAVYPAR
jgi:hypothetical protein